jgi:hypothetical protein
MKFGMNRLVLFAASLSVASGAAALGVAGCKKTPQVAFTLDVPADLAPPAAWYEVAVFGETSCAAVAPSLQGGIPDVGPRKRVAFRSGSVAPPLGDLPRGKYAFAAVARADDCGVVAAGCADVDVASANAIRITLDAVSSPAGACAAGGVCRDARCVPGTDNSDPTLGAGCTLDLLGAGPLGDPLTVSGTAVSAPAIAATDTGFVLGYREFSPFDGVARLTTIPIDNGGGLLAAQVTGLNTCANSDESDGTGLGFGAGSGVVAVSRPPCGGVGGVDLFSIDAAGTVQMSGFSGQAGASVTLSNAHALALRPGTSGYLLGFTGDGTARVVSGSGVVFSNASSTFGGAGAQEAWVAASDKVVALLAGSAGGSAPPPPLDAGDEAGAADAAPLAAAGDASSGRGTLHLNVVAAGADLAALPGPVDFPGTWASLAALGTRVVVASDGVVPGKPVAWRVFDLGGATAAASDGFTTDGAGDVLYADVALHQDRILFAVERPGSIAVVVYDHAATAPAFLRQVVLGVDPRVPSLATVRDGRLAIAASDTRVAVVWTTGKTLTQNDAVGGYAVFACTP